MLHSHVANAVHSCSFEGKKAVTISLNLSLLFFATALAFASEVKHQHVAMPLWLWEAICLFLTGLAWV